MNENLYRQANAVLTQQKKVESLVQRTWSGSLSILLVISHKHFMRSFVDSATAMAKCVQTATETQPFDTNK